MIEFCQGLKKKDFVAKNENVSRKRKGKREYLNDTETNQMMKEPEKYFESNIEIPRIRHGKQQKLETLINEEAILLGKYLRDEITKWTPSVVSMF